MPRVLIFASLLLLALPPVAEAKTFLGRTSQGRKASLVTDKAGVPKRIRVEWRAPCRQKGMRAFDRTFFTPKFDAVSADMVQDAGSYTVMRGNLRTRITGSLAATRAGDRWNGTLTIRAVYRRGGKVKHLCQAKNIRWSVGPRG